MGHFPNQVPVPAGLELHLDDISVLMVASFSTPAVSLQSMGGSKPTPQPRASALLPEGRVTLSRLPPRLWPISLCVK